MSPRSVWAVGYPYVNTEYPRVMHWNGKSWRLQPTPFAGVKGAGLTSVSAVTPADVGAVGNHLIVRHSC